MKLRLGELTFDPDARQLLSGEKELHLSPKAIDLLRILIAHRPRALAKQELHAAVLQLRLAVGRHVAARPLWHQPRKTWSPH